MSECHHGWRGASVDDGNVIRTPCPGCGGQLFIGSGGHLTCSVLECNHDPGIERYWNEQKAELTRLRAKAALVDELAGLLAAVITPLDATAAEYEDRGVMPCFMQIEWYHEVCALLARAAELG